MVKSSSPMIATVNGADPFAFISREVQVPRGADGSLIMLRTFVDEGRPRGWHGGGSCRRGDCSEGCLLVIVCGHAGCIPFDEARPGAGVWERGIGRGVDGVLMYIVSKSLVWVLPRFLHLTGCGDCVVWCLFKGCNTLGRPQRRCSAKDACGVLYFRAWMRRAVSYHVTSRHVLAE